MRHEHTSVSKALVRQPQAPYTLTESRSYLAAHRCLDGSTTTLDSLCPLSLKGFFNSGSCYHELAGSIASIQQRRWFGEPRFPTLSHKKRVSIVERRFNNALHEPLLELNSNFTCRPVALLEKKGLRYPPAWRGLSSVPSYYHLPLQHKGKILPPEELEYPLFDGHSPYYGRSSGLKQHLDTAIIIFQ